MLVVATRLTKPSGADKDTPWTEHTFAFRAAHFITAEESDNGCWLQIQPNTNVSSYLLKGSVEELVLSVSKALTKAASQ